MSSLVKNNNQENHTFKKIRLTNREENKSNRSNRANSEPDKEETKNLC